MRQRSAYPLALMDRQPASISTMLSGLSKNFGSIDVRFPAGHSFVSYLIACEAVQICASPTFLLSEGYSAFADQRMALFRSRFQYAENPLLCPSGAKGAHFAGILEDCWLLLADSKRPKTVWWTNSRANHSPPPNSVNKPNLGPNWSNLPLPVMRTECVNERIRFITIDTQIWCLFSGYLTPPALVTRSAFPG